MGSNQVVGGPVKWMVAFLSSCFLFAQGPPRLVNAGTTWRFGDVPQYLDSCYSEGRAWIFSEGRLRGFQPHQLESGGASVSVGLSDTRRFFNMAKWRNGKLFCRSGEAIYAWDRDLAKWDLWLSPGKRFMAYEIGPDGSVLLVGPMPKEEKASTAWFLSPLRLLGAKSAFLEMYAPHATEPKWTENLPTEVASASEAVPNILGFDRTWALGDHTLIYSSQTGFLFRFTWTGRKLKEIRAPWARLDLETLKPALEFQKKGIGRFKQILVDRKGFPDMDLYCCPSDPFQAVLVFRKHYRARAEMESWRARLEGTDQAVIEVGDMVWKEEDIEAQGWQAAILDLENGETSPLIPVSGKVIPGNWYLPNGQGLTLQQLIEKTTLKVKASGVNQGAEGNGPADPISGLKPTLQMTDPPEGWENIKIAPRKETPKPSEAPKQPST